MTKPRVLRVDTDSYREGLAQAPATGQATLLSYKADCWQKESNESRYPGQKLCCSILKTRQAKQPDCNTAPVVWRVVQRNSVRSFSIAYYCDEHLPVELRPLASQEVACD